MNYKLVMHTLISRLFSNWYSGQLKIKPIIGSKMKLCYEVSQHLIFYGKKEISYEKEIWNNIVKFVVNSNLVFDIGGNIGQYAIRFSEHSKCVISFEPDTSNYSFLIFNKYLNKLDNLSCINVGIGAKKEKGNLYKDSKTGGRTSSFLKNTVGQNYSGENDIIDIRTLDELIEEFGVPDFVKIDVEGFEVKIIKGLTKPNKKTKYLIETREDTCIDVFEYFINHNFLCYNVDHKDIEQIVKTSQLKSFGNYLFISDGN